MNPLMPQTPVGQDNVDVPVWYTGKNLNAAAGSRTAIASDIAVGYLVCFDPYGWDRGIMKDVTKPLTGNLHLPAGIVTYVSPDNVRGGEIRIMPLWGGRKVVSALTKANMTLGVTHLGGANDAWELQAISLDPTSAATLATAVAKVAAVAFETVDTSGTAAVKKVSLGAL